MLRYNKKNKFIKYFFFFFRQFLLINATSIFIPIIYGLDFSRILILNSISNIIYMFVCCRKNKYVDLESYLGPNFIFFSPQLIFFLSKNKQENLIGAFIFYAIILQIIVFFVIKFGFNWINFFFPPEIIGLILISIILNVNICSILNNRLILNINEIWNLKYDFIFIFTILVIIFSIYICKNYLFMSIWISTLINYILSIILKVNKFNNNNLYDNDKLKLFYYPNFDINVIILLFPFVFISLTQHINCFFLIKKMKKNEDLINNYDLFKSVMINSIVNILSIFIGSIPLTLYHENLNLYNLKKKKIFLYKKYTYFFYFKIILFSLFFYKLINLFFFNIPLPVLLGVYFFLCSVIFFSGISLFNYFNIYNVKNILLLLIMFLININDFKLNIWKINFNNIILSIIICLLINFIFKIFNYIRYTIF